MTNCLRCFVTGRVQGVWFRASTAEEARRLALKGYARNLPDGQVEVLACGEQKSLAALEAWLWQGPPAARVDDVACSAADEIPPQGFITR